MNKATRIQFENGPIVEFDGDPTPEDIDEVEQRIFGNAPNMQDAGPSLAERASSFVDNIPSPFQNPFKIEQSDALDPLTFPARKMSEMEQFGPKMKERAQKNIEDFVASPPPEGMSETRRDIVQNIKGWGGGAAATALEMAPDSPTQALEYELFGLGMKGLAALPRSGSFADKALARYFPKAADFLFKEHGAVEAIPKGLQSAYQTAVYNVKKAFGVPQETGLVSWAKEALARGEITPAEAAKMDQSIFDSMREVQRNLKSSNPFQETSPIIPEPAPQPPIPAPEPPMAPPPSAITPADLPSPDLSKAVATMSQSKPFYLPSLGPQVGPERIGMAASKMAETMGLTSQNILDAMADSAMASSGGEIAANAAFFSRIPLVSVLSKTQLGAMDPVILDQFVQRLKEGDPAATQEFMDKLVASHPVLAEVFPKIEPPMPEPMAPEPVLPEPVKPKLRVIKPKPALSPRQDYTPILEDIIPRDLKSEGVESIGQFVRRSGGINPNAHESGDIRELERTDLMNTRSGMSLDRMREAAAEAGYLPRESTGSDLIELLREDSSGNKKYPLADIGESIPPKPVEYLRPEEVDQAIEDLTNIAERRKLRKHEMKIFSELREMKRNMKEKPVEEEYADEGDTSFNFAEPGAQYGDQTKTPAFKKWFGDSEVVDAQGKPLVVYHGTLADFNEFDLSKAKEIGFHFGTSEQASNRIGLERFGAPLEQKYENLSKVKNYPSIKPVYLSIKNPIWIPSDLGDWSDIPTIKEYFGPSNYDVFTNAEMEGWKDSSDVREAFIGKGYDGIRYDNQQEGKGDSWVAFYPEQIKSAIGNSGAFDPNNPNILKESPAQYGKAPTFYSGLQRIVAEKMPNRAGVDQVRSIISGGKKEEIDWSGINEWLEGKQTVTKQEVMDFLKSNEVQVQEVVKGETKESILQDLREQGYSIDVDMDGEASITYEGEYVDYEDLPGNIQKLFDQYSNSVEKSQTKFSRWQLPGGENYRELLLTLPAEANPIMKDHYTLFDQYGNATASGDEIASKRWEKEIAQNESKKDWKIKKTREIDKYKNPKLFKSSHFDEPNVLAHVRFNDRVDADGKRVLFLEEVQSDWHQKGRDGGYKKDEYVVTYLDDTNSIQTKIFNNYADAEKFLPTVRASQSGIRHLQNGSVPNAPFKKTWHELALKRMLRYAAENGYDKLAWTTGEQQAERYDLSKQVGKLLWNEETQTLTAYDVDRKKIVIQESDATKEKLVDYVGKDAAEKLTNVSPDSDGNRELSGLDLKVGGEGMKGFYDQMIPSFLNKYAKKWGGRVGLTEIDAGGFSGDQADFESGRGEILRTPVHSLELTPSMKSEVLEKGQSLFEPKPEFGKLNKVVGYQGDMFTGGMEPVTKAGMEGKPSEEMPLFSQAKPKFEAPKQSPELKAALDTAQEIQGDLPLESNQAQSFKEPPPMSEIVAQSNITTKLQTDGYLPTTSMEYRGPEDAVAMLYHLKNDTNENVYFLLLDEKNKIIGVNHNSIGGLRSAEMNTDTILKLAKKAGAKKIIPVHNHPSGNVQASKDDLEGTFNLRKTAKQYGIEVGDHVIIDHGEFGVIDENLKPSIQKFVEPKERPLQARLLKLGQERELMGTYQGLTVRNGMIAAEIMKGLVDKNKNTLFAMILNNRLGINAITPLATSDKFSPKVADALVDAVINHAGAHVVLAANSELERGLVWWISSKLQPLQVTLKDMIFPDASFSDYTSMAESNPEYFAMKEPEGKYGVSEDIPEFQKREDREKKALIVEIRQAIALKSLTTPTVARIRTSFNMGKLREASLENLIKLRDFIGTLQKGDSFLSEKQLAGLKDILKGIERPDITPRRIIIDQFGEKSEVMSGPLMGKISNELIPTVDIKEGHPMVQRAVDDAEMKLDHAVQEISRRDENFEKMISKAEASRKGKLGLIERLKRAAAPQNKEIFQALSGQKVDLTREEAAVVAYMRNFFEKVRKDLELEKYRKNYVTHMEKPLLEKIFTEGVVDAAAGLFKSDKPLNIPVNIMLELDNIIGGTKFFKYALERKGGMNPTTNLRKVLHGYSTMYETKKALDQFLPEGQAIVQLLLKNRTARWMKTFLQNLKGRGLDFNFRFGKMGWLTRVADQIVTLGYYKLLGINYMSAIKNVIAGESNAFIYQDFGKYLNGKYRFYTNPKKTFDMAQKYGVFEGTYTEYAQQGIDKLRKLGDLAMVGQKIGEIEIRGSLFAAELTPAEWATGEILSVRAREIKDVIAMTQGIFSKTESPLFLQTWYGRLLFQMNRWRITNAMLFKRLAQGAKEEYSRGEKNGTNMRRLAKMFLLYGLGMYYAHEWTKTGNKKMAGMARAAAESLNSIIELVTIKPIYDSLVNNPTYSILGEFVFTIQELANYIGVPGAKEPQKVTMNKGIEDTYISSVKTVKDLFGLNKPKVKYSKPKSLEASIDRNIDRNLEGSIR